MRQGIIWEVAAHKIKRQKKNGDENLGKRLLVCNKENIRLTYLLNEYRIVVLYLTEIKECYSDIRLLVDYGMNKTKCKFLLLILVLYIIAFEP